MTWNVVQNGSTLQLIPVGEPIPEGWVVVAETSNPDYLAPGPRVRVVSKLEFRRRFNLMERVAIDNSPENAMLPEQARAVAKTILTDLMLAEEINLDDPDVLEGLQFFASVGLLTPQRVTEILK